MNNVSETNDYNNHDNSTEKKEEYFQVKVGRRICFKIKKALPDLRKTAMSKHIDTRRKLAEIAEVESFNNLINRATLSTEDKHILVLHYINGYDLRFIADHLGYSESTIKRRHRKALVKIAKIL